MSSATTPLGRRLAALEAEQAAEVAPAKRRFRPPSLVNFVQVLQIPDRARGGTVPFTLYPRQREALATIAKSERTVWVKARQVGATTSCLALALYVTQYTPHRNVLVTRQALEEAKDSIRRAKQMHASIPAELRPQPIVEDNVQSLAFANGSRIDALTSTSSVGRGRSAYLGIADELAYWPEPERQLVALASACEKVIVVSTGNGQGDHLHKIWKQATANKGRWTPLFLDWKSVPSRDADWYQVNVSEAVEPRLARREYPSLVSDAFASPAGIFFERFDPTVNVADVTVVPTWRTVRAVDFGWHHGAALWIATAPSGQPYVVSELLVHRQTTAEFAEAILQRDRALGVRPVVTFCDPAGKGVAVQTAESEFEVFRRAGLNPRGRASGVRDGVLRIMSALADPDLPLVISREGCPWLVEALANVRPDRHRPDLPDEGSDYAHVIDALRYALVNVSATASTFTPPKYIGAESWEHRLHRLEF